MLTILFFVLSLFVLLTGIGMYISADGKKCSPQENLLANKMKELGLSPLQDNQAFETMKEIKKLNASSIANSIDVSERIGSVIPPVPKQTASVLKESKPLTEEVVAMTESDTSNLRDLSVLKNSVSSDDFSSLDNLSGWEEELEEIMAKEESLC